MFATLAMLLFIKMSALNKFSDLGMTQPARLLHPSNDMD